MDDDLVFEWDEAKAAANEARNRPSFNDVVFFDFGAALVTVDDRRDYGERRSSAIGLVNGRHHVLVYTKRGARLRVISFRKANSREIKRYDRHAKIADRPLTEP